MPPELVPKRPLKPRHRLFIDQYLIDLNGKEAAIRVGYAPSDAHSRAARLLRRPEVKAAIGAAMAARAARTDITAARVLEEYALIAFADLRRFADWGPKGVRFRGAAALSAEDTRAVAELVEGDASRAGLHRVKLFDKLAALRSLQRILDGADAARFRLAAEPAARVLPAPKKSARPQFTLRERRFAAEYVEDFAGTAAAIRAGYAPGGARSRATALLRHPRVAAAIEAGIEARRVSIRAAADRVLAEYARVAFADIGRIASWNAKRLRIKARRRLAPDDTAAIESLGAPSGARLRLRLYDKVYALDALARHLGLLDPRMPGRPEWLSGSERRTSVALRARLGGG
ncbi:MAG TPA: terminase small subunit [Stellaceae bacterium]|nr:terminase small subunit [Stellaceae bacterium]